MYVLSRFPYGGRRLIVGLLLAVALFFNTVGTLFAGTTGTISGTVTDGKTKLPLSGVTVAAVSPTGSFTTKTDSKGFYAINGVSPDTYTVSFELVGYQAEASTGNTVAQDSVTRVDSVLSKSLATIGRVVARSSAGAFQPTQTQDTYTVNTAQIETINGRAFNTNEANLLTSLPGASLDANGYPVLRGGRENESGYTFEGISIADSFSNQFQNSLSVNGIGSFQVVPGAGNATIGNAGTGSINYTSKRGTYPGFGSLEGEVQSFPYTHQFTFEYGFATPSGNLSNYVSFIGQRNGNQVGQRGISAVDIGQYNTGLQDTTENNFEDNLIYKFGKDKSYELQLLYQNQIDRFGFNYGGGIGTLHDDLSDPYQLQGLTLGSLPAFLGFTQAQVNSAFGSLPGHPNGALLPQSAQYQPNEVYKIQLSHNFDASTFLRVAYYGVNAITTFDLPDPNIFGAYELQGSDRNGISADLTKQLNSRNLLQVGGKFEYQKPDFAVQSVDDAAEAVGGLGPFFGIGAAQGLELADFIPANSPGCNATLSQFTAAPEKCGYLAQFFGGHVPTIPLYDRTAQVDRGDYSFYVNDQLSASDRLKFELGLRLDGNAAHFPNVYDGVPQTIPHDASHPNILEPRASFNYQATRDDSVRGSFARSTQFPPLADVARTINRADFNEFNNVPSYDNLLGAYNPAMPAATQAQYCGPKQNLPCPNYAEQLFSEYQYGVAGTAIQPVKPETFTSYDFSYSHQFKDNVGVRVTPFYTRGYDIVDRVASVIGFNPESNKPILSPALSTNNGVERTTGLEFQLTKEAAYGFSGQVSATYINKFSNVPPLATSEDFFPTIPTASLALGDIYHVGYLSPFQATAAVQYKTHGGLRINPQITYNKGYPQNPGLTTATFINGKAVNLPLTDVTGPGVGRTPSQYVDPANPGTVFNPNIAAALGTPETSVAGGALSNARFNTNLTIELSPPGSKSTFGVQIFNLFNQLYGRPELNTAAQPIAYGVLGPQTGKLYNYQYPFQATTPYLAPTPVSQYGQSPYVILQDATPTAYLFYYQLKL